MKTEEKIENVSFRNRLRNDEVYVHNELRSMSGITGREVRKGLEQAILSEGKIVNVVSKSYGHLPNEKFFPEVEVKLIDAGMNYLARSINRDNRSFTSWMMTTGL